MGFLTDQERATLRLARISFHIVGGDDEFRPQPELPVEHDDFILDIIRDVASDSVYSFAEISTTRDNVMAMARRDVSFEAGAQALAADFARFHKGTARDGAFFVFELAVDDEDVGIYALVKYDYSQALEVVEREGATGLRRIVEAFVSDRSSIQKAAMIRTVRGVAEAAVSTRDRSGRPSPNLTDFFQNYLEVRRVRNDAALTAEVKDLVRLVLVDHKEYLPPGGVATAVSRAVDVVRNAPEVNEDVLRQAVWVGAGQPDEAIKQKLDASVDRLLKRKRLAGLAFVPDHAALPRNVRRQVRTEEGVILEYNTALEGRSVLKSEADDGTTTFTITTRKYSDGVIADTARRPAR